MNITKSDVLLIALLLSLGLNIYEIFFKSGMGYCYEEKRNYTETSGGGKEITAETARDLIMRYRENHCPDMRCYDFTGWQMSKLVFNDIFKNEEVNAVSFALCSYNDSLFLIAAPGVTEKNAIESNCNSNIFITQAFCPNDCLNE